MKEENLHEFRYEGGAPINGWLSNYTGKLKKEIWSKLLS